MTWPTLGEILPSLTGIVALLGLPALLLMLTERTALDAWVKPGQEPHGPLETFYGKLKSSDFRRLGGKIQSAGQRIDWLKTKTVKFEVRIKALENGVNKLEAKVEQLGQRVGKTEVGLARLEVTSDHINSQNKRNRERD